MAVGTSLQQPVTDPFTGSVMDFQCSSREEGEVLERL